MKTKENHGPLRSGFTLMELLIVICIIGILAGLVVGGAVRLIGSATEKRNATNAERLRAAIIEYWHDKGRWPVPTAFNTPPLSDGGSVTTELGSDAAEKQEDAFAYQIVLDQSNGQVVQMLLDVQLDGAKKTFLDLHGFSAPAGDAYKPKKDDLFVHEVVDAWGAWKGTATDEAGNQVGPVAAPVLCFFTKVIACPIEGCGGYDLMSATECSNDKCPYLGEDAIEHWDVPKYRYKYTKADKARAETVAIPYTITFNLDNNDVFVEAKTKKKTEEEPAQ